jgi:hypothetical protein
MKTLLAFALISAAVPFAAPHAAAAEADTRCFEMRVYYAPAGKLDALNARFRDHTLRLFEKHGISNIGYFTPVENKDNKLVYFLAYPSREAREKSWKAFFADPEWQKAQKESEVGGKLVARVDQLFLNATDYSPAIQPAKVGDRVFELRTYTASPGNLANLHARFRDHTVKLFAKHGMSNIAYWSPMKGQKGENDTLIYILAHKSVDAGKASFGAFGKDPDWQAARKASEEKGGGSLTAKGGVKSEFMVATDYSPLK